MGYKIPLFDLNFDSREEKAVISALRSKWISMGPQCAGLEKEFSKAIGTKHSVSVANCTAGLHLVLKALDIGPGDEVLVPSLTFVATVNCVKYVSAVPVFCDITSFENPVIDPQEIVKKITKKTKAVIVMHYAGFSCDMSAIMEIARKKRIKVVEDACHGPLSEYGGTKLGTFGSAGCFSFFSNKNISTGEGGMVVTDDEEIAEKIRLLRSHGMTTMSYDRARGHSTAYDVVALGYNYRLDDIRASIARVQLKKLGPDINKRVRIRELYKDSLRDCKKITIPFINCRNRSSCYIMPVVLKDSDEKTREAVRRDLAKNGIQTSIHYPPVHMFSIYGGRKVSLPRTECYSACEITLPIYGSLSKNEVVYISKKLKAAL